MAGPKSVRGSQILVQIGDGADPEVFATDCLINAERGIAFSTDTSEQVIPDCDNPDDPAWKEVTKDGLSATITGAGILNTPSIADMFAWLASDDARNCRVLLNGVTLANGGGYWAGAFKLTAFEITGAPKERATSTITLVSHGTVTWVPAAA